MTLILLWHHLFGQLHLVLGGFVGPVLGYTSTHIYGLSFFWLARLLDRFLLEVKYVTKAIFVVWGLDMQISRQGSLLPVDS